jgi:prolyl oligopeptidase
MPAEVITAKPPVPPGPPIAKTVDTVAHDFGLDVADPYRWMEGSHNDDFATWLLAQGDWAAKQLAKLPGRDKLRARVTELGLGVTAVWGVQVAGDRMLYSTLPAGKQLAKLMVRDAKGDRVLIDPETLGTADTHASLNAYSISPDGKLVAYVIAMGGGEIGAMHVMDLATGKDLPEMAPPQPGADPFKGWVEKLHELGKPVDADITVLGRNPEATFKLAASELPGMWIAPDSQWMVVQSGGAHSETHVAVAKLSELDTKGTSKTPWREVADFPDGIEGAMEHGDRLYMATYKDAPNRKIISVPFAKPELAKARVEIPEDPDASLVNYTQARDAIYVVHNVNGRARLSRWPWKGKLEPIALPTDGWVHDLSSDPLKDGLTMQVEDWLHPGRYYRYEPKTKQLAPIALESKSDAVSDRVVAEEVEAASADGTKVPLTILHLKDIAFDGSHPTVVGAYAGYGVSQNPGFSATRLAWLERGGVLAVCHARGGGEKGKRWQDDGSHDKKLNGIRDLVACSQYLVDHKYTSTAKLGIEGGSMGGVIVGRALTERPDLFAAVHVAVGIVNPLRILAADNGANQVSELGDPSTEPGYKSILEMDPYTHVKAGTAYPAVIFTIGLNDKRVAPWMTGKMSARMMAATTSKKPILVRVEGDAGHGIGSTRDQAFAERADVWAFMLAAFGDPDFAPPADR